MALAVLAILLHSFQSSLYDFYRTEYIRIVKKREAVDPDAPEALRAVARTDSRMVVAGWRGSSRKSW